MKRGGICRPATTRACRKCLWHFYVLLRAEAGCVEDLSQNRVSEGSSPSTLAKPASLV